MAVLIEGYCVIVRKDAIEKRFVGGWDRFIEFIHGNDTSFCSDNEIASVGFTEPFGAKEFLLELKDQGLNFFNDDVSDDVVLIDQFNGIIDPCPWLRFSRLKNGVTASQVIAVCSFFYCCEGIELDTDDESIILRGDPPQLDIHMPEGWKFEGSLSEAYTQ